MPHVFNITVTTKANVLEFHARKLE